MTIVRRGFIDHSDSLGATARFGRGDVQWLTAGRGIVHSEMFPLLERDRAQPARAVPDLAQPARRRQDGEPHFTMLWSEDIPRTRRATTQGRADRDHGDRGPLAGARAAAAAAALVGRARRQPTSRSGRSAWRPARAGRCRARAAAHEPHAVFLSRRRARGSRSAGSPRTRAWVCAAAAVELEAAADGAELLLLQGRPIGEPVVQHGPFVMNTRAEIQQAFADYQRTQFGGWPWPSDDPVHARDAGRFARHADGRVEDADGGRGIG